MHEGAGNRSSGWWWDRAALNGSRFAKLKRSLTRLQDDFVLIAKRR
jgi:hypothetical protein